LKVGFVTIGQAPRVDVMNDIRPLLPANIEVVERGALDDFTKEDIERLLKPSEGEVPYVTRLRDGSEVKVSKEKIYSLVEKKLRELVREGVDLIVILCSGEFPEYDVEIPVIYPDRVLKNVVSALSIRGVLGVLAPAKEQLEYMKERWMKVHPHVEVRAISPYTAKLEEFEIVGKEFSAKGIRFVVMDCIGYTLRQKEVLRKALGSNAMIINTRSIVARILSELSQ